MDVWDEAAPYIRVLEESVAVHRDTAILWRKRAEDAEALNAKLRYLWTAKVREMHLLKQKVAALEVGQETIVTPRTHRQEADAAVGCIIRRS